MDPISLGLVTAAAVVWNSSRIDKLEREARDRKDPYADLFDKTKRDPYEGMFDDLRKEFNY